MTHDPARPVLHEDLDPRWPRFLGTLLATGLGVALALAAFLLVVDGYDTVFFAPRFDREPVTSNQRFAFPALAREERFDSAIIGTSTTRLFRPAELDRLFDARFVNLSMNDATAWEQAQIFSVFRRHHSAPRVVIFGIDAVWCAVGDDFRKLTPRPFPAWMYDDDPWNDLLNLFNLPALEETGRQFAYLTGLRKPKYGKDGYTNFLPPDSAYDPKRAILRIYGPGGPVPPPGPVSEPVSDAEARSWRFPMHPLMQEMLAGLPRATVKLFAVVPYHIHNQPAPGSRAARQWQECKARLAAMAMAAGNGYVVDFMIESPLTATDSNYWDPLHFTTAVAARLEAAMAEATREKRDRPGLYRYFGPSG
ncbi:MAG: hypothetical protein IT562_03815 [Alphaproteobacteria bacterium]|nr:hypothetical protein [Alphaproteobacteria bacterium]